MNEKKFLVTIDYELNLVKIISALDEESDEMEIIMSLSDVEIEYGEDVEDFPFDPGIGLACSHILFSFNDNEENYKYKLVLENVEVNVND